MFTEVQTVERRSILTTKKVPKLIPQKSTPIAIHLQPAVERKIEN